MKLGDWLREIREKDGASIPDMAAKLDVNKNTLGGYERGERLPDIDFLISFAHITGEDFFLLLEMRIKESPAPGADQAMAYIDSITALIEKENPLALGAREDRAEYAAIPLYDVRAAAGNGSIIDREEVVDFLHFKQEWIRTELHASPLDLYLLYVEGGSMEPTLRSDDIILVDRRDHSQARDGIYLIRMDGTLLVKRLQRLPGGVIKVSSDNPAYEPFTLTAEQLSGFSFDIIGRVVWSGRRM